MRKNQNTKKEEMFLAIEIWQDSQLTQSKFCNQEGISLHSFKYWYNKYKIANDKLNILNNKDVKKFIPVEVSSEPETSIAGSGQIEITFPNGIQISCPVDMNIHKLRILLGI